MHAIPCLFLFCFPLLDALLHEEVSHTKTKTDDYHVDGAVFVLGLHCLGATGGSLSGFACTRRGAGSGLRASRRASCSREGRRAGSSLGRRR
jgi:hypothetical protein